MTNICISCKNAVPDNRISLGESGDMTREQRRQRMIRRLNIALIVAWGLVLIGCIALWAIG